MQIIPPFDFIGTSLLMVIFVTLILLQWRFPLRKQHFAFVRRLVRNLLLSIRSHVVLRWAMLPIPIAIGAWARETQFGLLNWIPLPIWMRVVVSFLLMDYAYW